MTGSYDPLLDNISEFKLQKVCAEDLDVVNSARISYATHKETLDLGDEKLIQWLMKNDHSSPFGHNYFKFKVKAPIFVARQWFKHTVFHTYNEVSLRYTTIEPEFYVPKFNRRVGKPGNYEYVSFEDDKEIKDLYCLTCKESVYKYNYMINSGVAPEQARMVLPVSTYTEFIWSCNALSLMNFIKLRSHKTAQQEIRAYSDKAFLELEKHMPVTAAAFKETLGEGYEGI